MTTRKFEDEEELFWRKMVVWVGCFEVVVHLALGGLLAWERHLVKVAVAREKRVGLEVVHRPRSLEGLIGGSNNVAIGYEALYFIGEKAAANTLFYPEDQRVAIGTPSDTAFEFRGNVASWTTEKRVWLAEQIVQHVEPKYRESVLEWARGTGDSPNTEGHNSFGVITAEHCLCIGVGTCGEMGPTEDWTVDVLIRKPTTPVVR